jgi:hypothetical protein
MTTGTKLVKAELNVASAVAGEPIADDFFIPFI